MNHVALTAFLALMACCLPTRAQTYDIVINGGRVIDPGTGLDAVRNVGISGNRIAAVSGSPLTGKAVIDARGLIVSPGFIDLHAHGQDAENQRYQVQDGVTTALELEVGTGDVNKWYRDREGKRIVNSGVSAGHVPNRIQVMNDASTTLLPTGPGARRTATPEEISAMQRRLQAGLAAGSLGVGLGIQYTPAASHEEILQMFRIAGARKAPVFVHIRHMGVGEPQSALDALEEVIAGSALTQAPVHVVHLSSIGLKSTPQLLAAIAEARAHGLDITTECYPYDTAETELQSAMFDPGWQRVLGIDFGGLEWAATGERLTATTFESYRKQGGLVLLHMIPADVVQLSVTSPLTLIASDGLLSNGKGHPRTAGTYSRVLGKYVRESNALTWMEALRKMTIAPAQRLETYVPDMHRKGRVQVGADADLTIFDPLTIADRATFKEPTLASVGIRYVLVNGGITIRGGNLDNAARFGRAVRAPQAHQ